MKQLFLILTSLALTVGCGGDDEADSTTTGASAGGTETTGSSAGGTSAGSTSMDSNGGTSSPGSSTGDTSSASTSESGGDPTTSDGSTGTTDPSAGDSSGSSTGGGTGSSSGSPLMCTDCAQMACADVVTACTEDPDCNCLWDCLADSNPGQCANMCGVGGNSNMQVSELFDCLDMSCAESC